MKKQTRKEWAAAFAARLPEKPSVPESMLLEHCAEELGPEFLLYKRASVPPVFDGVCNGFEFLVDDPTGRSHWGSEVKCTACGETTFCGWIDGHLAMTVGEDGMSYPGPCDSEDYNTLVYEWDANVCCPICGETVRSIRPRELRNGRTYATQILTVERVKDESGPDKAVLMYWLLRRTVNSYGYSTRTVEPREAIVIGADRTLTRYTHATRHQDGERLADKWRPVTRVTDPEYIAFYCWGNGWGTSCRNTVGANIWPRVPDLEGSTGEKSGLADYVKQQLPAVTTYLQMEKRHPNLENLVRAGWAFCIAEAINADLPEDRLKGILDLKKAKPHEMVHMQKADFKAVKLTWTYDEMVTWTRVKAYLTPAEYEAITAKYKGSTSLLVSIAGADIKKADKYLDRQTDLNTDIRVEYLRDYRNALKELVPEPQEAELWPPHLRAAHDRMTAALTAKADEKYAASFAAAYKRYSALEWTDGKYCIVVPRSNSDLVHEGHVLHHCVGGYGKQHISGCPIFFVRRYRRPERSYFTLNEDLTGLKPSRIQLHGYKNELIGRQSPRKIPTEVLAFCEAWERDVLTPWMKQQNGTKTTINERKI